MTVLRQGLINNRWQLWLPEFRISFHKVRPTWQSARLESCRDMFEPGMTIYDVGATHGDYTALYQKWVGPQGNVFPVEPAVAYWPCIRSTFAANGFRPPRAHFVGFMGDKVDLSPPNTNIKRPYGAGWPEYVEGDVVADPGFMHLAHHADRIPTTTIDWLTRSSSYPPQAIVIDVEGAELRVLKGAHDTLVAHSPFVYVTVNQPMLDNYYGGQLIDIHGYMKGLGYSGTQLENRGEGEDFWLYTKP